MKISAYRVELVGGETFFRLSIFPIEQKYCISEFHQAIESVEALAVTACRVALDARGEDRRKPDFGQRERKEVVIDFLEHECVDYTDNDSPELRIPLSKREKKRFWKAVIRYYGK